MNFYMTSFFITIRICINKLSDLIYNLKLLIRKYLIYLIAFK